MSDITRRRLLGFTEMVAVSVLVAALIYAIASPASVPPRQPVAAQGEDGE